MRKQTRRKRGAKWSMWTGRRRKRKERNAGE